TMNIGEIMRLCSIVNKTYIILMIKRIEVSGAYHSVTGMIYIFSDRKIIVYQHSTSGNHYRFKSVGFSGGKSSRKIQGYLNH
ncbi:hypothetical protein DOS79_03890, partial [Staphylococcus felis]